MACELLHKSSYSSVFLGSPTPGQSLSCYKVYVKAYPLQSRHWLNISRECCILSRLHEARVNGVVQLISVADTPQHFSLQFKPCLGGNLYQSIGRQECCNEGHLCQKVVIPLLRVLADLHALGIIHRDIKPENIFFESDGQLVLGDFGLAIDSNLDKPCSRVGTHDYMAPEVLAQPSADTMAMRNISRSVLQPYNTAVDVWALGILVHEALTGLTPFAHREPALMALKAQFGVAGRLPGHVSPECQAFVDSVLQKQAGKRPSASALLHHPWVQKHIAKAAPAPKSVRIACPSKQQPHDDLAVLVSSDASSSSCCTGALSTCQATTRCIQGSGDAAAAAPSGKLRPVQHVGSAPNAGLVPSSSSQMAAKSAPGTPACSKPAKHGCCPVTYGFECPVQQRQQQEDAAAVLKAAAVASASSALEQRATIHSPSGNSGQEDPAQLVLVQALSAPMLLEPPITAPSGRTSESGTCSPAVDSSSSCHNGSSNWRMSAAAACPVKAPAASGGPQRGSSWSPGYSGGCMAAPPGSSVMMTSAAAAAGAAGHGAAAAAGAMKAPRDACAAACAAAAAAGVNAHGASAAAGAMKHLLSPIKSAAIVQRLKKSCSLAVRERRNSAELVLSGEGSGPEELVGQAGMLSCQANTHKVASGFLKSHRRQTGKATQQGPAVGAGALARSASEAHSALHAAMKMLQQVFRQSQQGHAF